MGDGVRESACFFFVHPVFGLGAWTCIAIAPHDAFFINVVFRMLYVVFVSNKHIFSMQSTLGRYRYGTLPDFLLFNDRAKSRPLYPPALPLINSTR